MSKGNKRRSNRESKKPKQKKEKTIAAADSTKGRTPINIGDARKR